MEPRMEDSAPSGLLNDGVGFVEEGHQGMLPAKVYYSGNAFADVGAFQLAARPLFAGTGSGTRSRGVSFAAACAHDVSGLAAGGASGSAAGSRRSVGSSGGWAAAGLVDLAEGPYFVLASQLDVNSLCNVDAACRLLCTLNRASIGPWRQHGSRAFGGLELDREGMFDRSEDPRLGGSKVAGVALAGGRKRVRTDWKGRYIRFRCDAATFRAPFAGAQITKVKHADEVAYCKCRLRSDLLDTSSSIGVYLEVEVLHNPDNLSLAVVDFEAGGRSSITFSPDTGAVIRERKIREAPRKVEGAYIQPLPATPLGKRFEGSVGVFLRAGHLAFFRRCCVGGRGDSTDSDEIVSPDRALGPWECTGFISDLAWAEGRRLTPCIAFRDEGAYCVRVSSVQPEPPLELSLTPRVYEGAAWSSLDWEAGTLGAE